MTASGDKQKIIYGVLNWGLGHATRSIPIIKAMIDAGFEPVLASDGAALELLRKEFPGLESEVLSAYNIRYGKRSGALIALAMQLPRIWWTTFREKKELKRLAIKYQPAGVISDNRLGFSHPDLPSVYITHQLKLMLPFARSWISGFHHRFIRNFQECWVPDFEGAASLTGDMTRNVNPGVPVRFTGPLSRFDRVPEQHSKYTTCSVLSGPEPQRSILESTLIEQLLKQPGRHLLVRGTQSGFYNPARSQENGNLEIVDFLSGQDLASKISQAEIVISRSGYSSIMDYRVLGNRALLIPTPGQPEQEYLARYMLSRGWFFYSDQEHLDLSRDLEKAMRFDGFRAENQAEPGFQAKDLFGLFKGE